MQYFIILVLSIIMLFIFILNIFVYNNYGVDNGILFSAFNFLMVYIALRNTKWDKKYYGNEDYKSKISKEK